MKPERNAWFERSFVLLSLHPAATTVSRIKPYAVFNVCVKEITQPHVGNTPLVGNIALVKNEKPQSSGIFH